MKRIGVLAAAGLLLAGCTSAQITASEAKVDAAFAAAAKFAVRVDPGLLSACKAAVTLVDLAGAFYPPVLAIAPWVMSGCTTVDGVLKLAGDPSSLEWITNLVATIGKLVPQRAG